MVQSQTAQPPLALQDMEVMILAGGLGTRLREETDIRPKPMVEINGRPILWHIMKLYSRFGIKNFVVCLGYKGDVIRDYFLNYVHHQSDIAVDLGSHSVEVLARGNEENWRVVLADTGRDANTGARLKKASKYLKNDVCMATYGDGVCDVDIAKLYDAHNKAGRDVTVTAVHPEARFGEIEIDGNAITEFVEKPQTGSGWINGGFLVFNKKVFAEMPDKPALSLEQEVLTGLASQGRLSAFQHNGFWQCVDTYREMLLLNEMCARGHIPWLGQYAPDA